MVARRCMFQRHHNIRQHLLAKITRGCEKLTHPVDAFAANHDVVADGTQGSHLTFARGQFVRESASIATWAIAPGKFVAGSGNRRRANGGRDGRGRTGTSTLPRRLTQRAMRTKQTTLSSKAMPSHPVTIGQRVCILHFPACVGARGELDLLLHDRRHNISHDKERVSNIRNIDAQLMQYPPLWRWVRARGMLADFI